MSGEAWAIVGVVVGAILGGAAQITADLIRNRAQKRVTLREERKAAYVEFSAACWDCVFWAPHLDPVRFITQRESGLAERAVSALARVNIATSTIELVAPDDTYQAARRVQGFYLRRWTQALDGERATEIDDFDPVDSHIKDFVHLAKRDVGTSVAVIGEDADC